MVSESVPPTDTMERLGRQLRVLRLRAGLTGKQLAQRIGTNQSRVSRTELARFRVSLDMVRRWLEVTGADQAERWELLELAERSLVETEPSRRTFLDSPGPGPASPDGVPAGVRHLRPFRLPDQPQTWESGMLEALGLAPAEEELWQALVDRPPATMGELCDLVGLSARTR
ncbi:helix-turn-helix domain-containing protein [Streptomyces sp. KR80]|uniref:helix-turn-helix domain-containing protein n=1 Tax=Streptomyces sp. KR80 TaxID=3457426 RepID=UPI003FD2870B